MLNSHCKRTISKCCIKDSDMFERLNLFSLEQMIVYQTILSSVVMDWHRDIIQSVRLLAVRAYNKLVVQTSTSGLSNQQRAD